MAGSAGADYVGSDEGDHAAATAAPDNLRGENAALSKRDKDLLTTYGND
jgi:hypothetical protein